MKNHLALLSLVHVQEPLVKEAMLKEAMPNHGLILAKLVSNVTNPIKNVPGVRQVRNSVVPKIKYDRGMRDRSTARTKGLTRAVGSAYEGMASGQYPEAAMRAVDFLVNKVKGIF